MKSLKALLFVAIGLSTWLGGCKVKHPGSPAGDTPPTTILSVAPRDSSIVNYYITLSWSGNDADGTIAGFRLVVDNDSVFTTSQDSTIAFYSPQDSVPALHHVKVLAIDDAGQIDPERNPSTGQLDTSRTRRYFYTVNQAPTAGFGAVGIANHDTVGMDFRVSVRSVSPRPSSTHYSIALDDSNGWTAWTTDSVFAFVAPDLLSDRVFPLGVFGISNAGLTPDHQHVVYIRARNAGGAISATAKDTIFVGSGPEFLPVMDTTVSATYGSVSLYPDGSVYYSRATGQTVSIVFSAHVRYKGEINAYRYRTGQFVNGSTVLWNAAWSTWQSKAEVDTTDLTPGDYPFQFMARDLANNLTDPDSFIVHIVEQALSDSVILVNDTKDGNGVPNSGSPRAASVNSFYDSVLTAAGVKHRAVDATIDPDNPQLSRHGVEYISPYDIRNAGLLVWHMDDPALPASNTKPDNRVRLMTEYFGKGGRVLVSGWNLMAKFTPDILDSVAFSATSFPVTRLKMLTAVRVTTRVTQGLSGDNGFPACRFDTTKVRRQWLGLMPNCYAFDPQGQDVVIGRIAVPDTLSDPNRNRPAAYIYDLSYRVAVFGVPLYFCHADEVMALLSNPSDPNHSVLTILMQGLHPAL